MGQGTPLVLIDTDVFVIDEIFTNDQRHSATSKFLEGLPAESRSTTFHNVLEFCGIVATATKRDPRKTFLEFHELKGTRILYPKLQGEFLSFASYLDRVLERIGRGMRYGDANVLSLAEDCGVDFIVTWNKRHYENRTKIQVRTPEEFFSSQAA